MTPPAMAAALIRGGFDPVWVDEEEDVVGDFEEVLVTVDVDEGVAAEIGPWATEGVPLGVVGSDGLGASPKGRTLTVFGVSANGLWDSSKSKARSVKDPCSSKLTDR